MNRRMLLRLTAPTVLIGAVLFATCVASFWSIHRLQANLADILSDNVASLEAAQKLEIELRQLRFHSFLLILDASPERRALVEQDHLDFERALDQARESANLPREIELVKEIQAGYRRYRTALATGGPGPSASRHDFIQWADAHPIRQLQKPCHELLKLNKEAMDETSRESEVVGQRAETTMLIAALLGPVSGLIIGYGVARALSRSIARLSVRLQDVHAQLDQEIASVRLAAGSDLGDLDRQLDHVVHRVREVAERVQEQQQEILRSEQLAAVGQLAASVAHEVRNPLTSIKMLVGAALRTPDRQALTADDLGVIYKEIGRLEQTVQTLLDYARPPRPQRQPTDVRDVIGQAIALVQARARQQGVTFDVRQPDGPVIASADRGQLATVLVNLLLNALDAMPQGGRVAIALAADGEVRLTVQDSGPGIAESVAPRLFTPFASTKPTGTGLGLSICRRIVEEHGGSITARNRPEGGAAFTLTLPFSHLPAGETGRG